jgi:hypothetical protein
VLIQEQIVEDDKIVSLKYCIEEVYLADIIVTK